MGLLFPSRSQEYSKKLGLRHWFKVLILLLITGVLTWYAKVYKPPQSMLRYKNEFTVWIMPHKNGLGALVVLPNDNNDSNTVHTGLRIWVSPPDSILALERNWFGYRGRNIVVVGDTLNDNLRQDLLSTLDGNGNFFWLTNLNEKYTGEDVQAELKLIEGNPQNYLLDLVYEGYKLRFFGSQTALDSAVKEPLSAAILMFKPEDEYEPPLKDDELIQALIWKGKNEDINSNRIALNYPEAVASIFIYSRMAPGVKRMHLKGWNPEW
jgi:hypothetical protein